jgi:hypothetical protein
VSELLAAALQENIHLERATVSSLLSRYKRGNLLDMKEGRYFLRKPSDTDEPPPRA